MKKTFLIIPTILIMIIFVNAQNSNEKYLKELDQKIEDVDKKLDNTPCNKTPVKCNDVAKAEKQRLFDEYYQLIDERKDFLKKNDPDRASQNWFEKVSENNPIFGIAIAIVPGFLILAFIMFLVIILKRTKVDNTISHGAASAAKEDDLQEFTKSNRENLKQGEFAIGNKINSKNYYHVTPKNLTFRHILLLGPSGTGKSRGFFMPNLENLASATVSVFVNDTKSELWETSSGYWKNAYRFAPLEPNKSSACNWIPLCTDENRTLTLKLARTIVTNGGENASKEAFWDRAETALLAALFAHTATTDTPTPAYAYDLLHSFDADGLTEILLNSTSRLAKEQARTFADSGERVRGSVLIGARVSLTWLGDPKIRRFTSSTINPINFGSMLRNSSTSIFWCLPTKAIHELRPLTCLVLVLVMEQVKEKQGNPVYLMLDEFANIGTIPSFSTEITLLRSEEVAIIAGIQSYGQLIEQYGREAAQTISDNFATKLILAGLEFESAEKVSKHLGDTTIIEEKISVTKPFNKPASKTSSIQKHARRLLTANEITQISDHEVLITSANKKPFFAEKYFFNKPPVTAKPMTCRAEITKEVDSEKVTFQKRQKPFPKLPKFD